MDEEKYKDAVSDIAARNRDYDIQAYFFVSKAITRTVEKIARSADSAGARHISGQELIDGALDFAIEQYGVFAPRVFEYWRMRTGSDMGEIVYRMIRAGILAAAKDDRQEDFDGGAELPFRLRALLAARYEPGPEPGPAGPIA